LLGACILVPAECRIVPAEYVLDRRALVTAGISATTIIGGWPEAPDRFAVCLKDVRPQAGGLLDYSGQRIDSIPIGFNLRLPISSSGNNTYAKRCNPFV
jgi:hypothetical protein